MRGKIVLVLVAVISSLTFPLATARGNEWLRTLGFGWSDGYHSHVMANGVLMDDCNGGVWPGYRSPRTVPARPLPYYGRSHHSGFHVSPAPSRRTYSVSPTLPPLYRHHLPGENTSPQGAPLPRAGEEVKPPSADPHPAESRSPLMFRH